ncbi:hypothetical protein [Leisingera sp. ANG-S5]|nr:hypothetical protein [Leisingera sp. ANG-S5]
MGTGSKGHRLRELAYRWKQFKAAKIALDDKLAAIRDADVLLAKIL